MTLAPCPNCGEITIYIMHSGQHHLCNKCGMRGPRNDPDGEKWNALPRRKENIEITRMTTSDIRMLANGCRVSFFTPYLEATDDARALLKKCFEEKKEPHKFCRDCVWNHLDEKKDRRCGNCAWPAWSRFSPEGRIAVADCNYRKTVEKDDPACPAFVPAKKGGVS